MHDEIDIYFICCFLCVSFVRFMCLRFFLVRFTIIAPFIAFCVWDFFVSFFFFIFITRLSSIPKLFLFSSLFSPPSLLSFIFFFLHLPSALGPGPFLSSSSQRSLNYAFLPGLCARSHPLIVSFWKDPLQICMTDCLLERPSTHSNPFLHQTST